MDWKHYALYPGTEHAGVGGFILEAHSNGSWVVRHVIGSVPARYSELEPVMNHCADINSAKAKAIEAFTAMMAEVKNPSNGTKEKRITLRLCERYQELRAAQIALIEGPPSHERENDVAALEEKMDEDVKRYVMSNQQK